MNIHIINHILLLIAILTTGVIYGTDMFHAIAGKKATALSKDSSIADLIGHTHFIADKRMPIIGMSSIISAALLTIINYANPLQACLSAAAFIMLLIHLALYIKIAKPVNTQMTDAALKNTVPTNIRSLQQRWDSVINYRAILLTIAMIIFVIDTMYCA